MNISWDEAKKNIILYTCVWIWCMKKNLDNHCLTILCCQCFWFHLSVSLWSVTLFFFYSSYINVFTYAHMCACLIVNLGSMREREREIKTKSCPFHPFLLVYITRLPFSLFYSGWIVSSKLIGSVKVNAQRGWVNYYVC